MIITKMKVLVYVQEGFDVKDAVSEYLLDKDWVSYTDVEVVSEKRTDKTFPDGTESEDNNDAEKHE
jgi:hypothetical protein